jgi:hypothetical protein
MADVVRVGDTVEWRGGWGRDIPKDAVVTDLTITDHPRDKYGEDVEEADWGLVHLNRVVFGLDNGHWAYSDQIRKAVKT